MHNSIMSSSNIFNQPKELFNTDTNPNCISDNLTSLINGPIMLPPFTTEAIDGAHVACFHRRQYTHDLHILQDHTNPNQPLVDDKRFTTICTPLKLDAWTQALKSHPDQQLASLLLMGIQDSFHIGFNHAYPLLQYQITLYLRSPASNNCPDYLHEQCTEGRIIGPAPFQPISRFGVIPKKHRPNKWRLILDLSFPQDANVNDGISIELCFFTTLQ